MNFAIGYLGMRCAYRIWMFLYSWYVSSLFTIGSIASHWAHICEQHVAVVVTARNLFKPLYQDASILGHILGFIFRLARLCVGFICLLAIYTSAVSIYILWALLPIAIIYWGFIYS